MQAQQISSFVASRTALILGAETPAAPGTVPGAVTGPLAVALTVASGITAPRAVARTVTAAFSRTLASSPPGPGAFALVRRALAAHASLSRSTSGAVPRPLSPASELTVLGYAVIADAVAGAVHEVVAATISGAVLEVRACSAPLTSPGPLLRLGRDRKHQPQGHGQHHHPRKLLDHRLLPCCASVERLVVRRIS